MSQVLQRPYDCKICGQQIRLSKIDNVSPDAKKKWNKFELDGVTVHVCSIKKQQQQSPPPIPPPQQQPSVSSETTSTDASKEIAAVERIEQLERKIDTLIAQIQMLRSDFKELKEKKRD